MGIFISILSNTMGSLFSGTFLAIVCVILMFVLIQSWYKNSQFSTASYIAGTGLFVLLSFQSILLCGAITVKSYINDIEVLAKEWESNISDINQLPQRNASISWDAAINEYPLIGQFADAAETASHASSDIIVSMSDELHSFLNYYILRRILWGAAFSIIGGLLIIKTMETSGRSGRNYSVNSSCYGSTRSHYSSRSGNRRRRYDD